MSAPDTTAQESSSPRPSASRRWAAGAALLARWRRWLVVLVIALVG